MRRLASRSRVRWLRAAIAAIALAQLLSASWYPFDVQAVPWVTNRAQVTAGGAIAFRSEGFAWTTEPAPWIPRAAATHEIAVALDVASGDPDQHGPARIFSVSLNEYARNLTVAQEDDALVVRIRHPGSTWNGTPPYVVPGVFADGARRAIEVRVAGARLAILVDGVERLAAALGAAPLGQWDPAYRVVLGNEMTVNRGWRGTVHGARVTVGGETIDYLAPGRLVLPARAWRTAWLREPSVLTGTGGPGAALWHALAFALVGAVLALASERSLTRREVLIAGLAVGLVVEAGQVVIAARHAAALDAVVDVAAFATGGTLATALRARLARRR